MPDQTTIAAGAHDGCSAQEGRSEDALRGGGRRAKQTKKRPDNATLLKLYSFYKQATDGDVSGDRPGGFDFVGGAKYDAWTKLKGMSADDAMTNYIKQVERLNRE